MDRAMCEQVGEQMMTMALDNLVRDGYVAFATLLLSRQNELTPLLLETVSDESKDKLAVMLRVLAPHLSAIVVISEAWTLEDSTAINALGPNNRVADSPQRKEGVFVQVASQQGDLLLTTVFTRDPNTGAPIRPTEIKKAWQRGVASRFQGLFA